MKLLGWMHRKFRQNSGDIFKDFTSGPTCNCLCARPSVEEHRHDSHRLRSENQALFADAEFFEGGGETVEFLLTIGTLGSLPVEVREEAVEDELETVEAIAEKQAEAATEAELMVVGEELEKVLAAAAAEKGGDRLSFASWKGAAAACPLQEYLFGSPVDVAETAESDRRKERRTSLRELFLMSSHEAVSDGGEVRSTAGMRLTMIKKLLKRRGPGYDSSSSGGGPWVNAAVESKFHKILKIFHKKVHPESTVVRKKHRKARDKGTPGNGDNGTWRGGSGGGDTLATSKNDWGKEGIPNLKSRLLGGESDSSGSREYWIKTDSDYLVLEL